MRHGDLRRVLLRVGDDNVLGAVENGGDGVRILLFPAPDLSRSDALPGFELLPEASVIVRSYDVGILGDMIYYLTTQQSTVIRPLPFCIFDYLFLFFNFTI